MATKAGMAPDRGAMNGRAYVDAGIEHRPADDVSSPTGKLCARSE
jgi:hypothetical protein